MILLEEHDGRFVPVLFPITGTYDCYGRIELSTSHPEHAHAEWLGCVLDLLWDEATLTSRVPLWESDAALGAGRIFAHAAASLFNDFELTLAGRRVLPCLYRDDVARAIEAASDGAPRAGESRLVDAWRRRNDELSASSGLLTAPPPETLAVAERFACVLRWAEAHGGLAPIARGSAWQHQPEDRARFAEEAWNTGDPVLRGMLRRWNERTAALRELAREAHEMFSDTARERAFAMHAVDLGTVAAVLRTSCDDAVVERIVAAIERSPSRDRVLHILRASPVQDAAVLANFDGVVSIRGSTLVLTADWNAEVVHEVDVRGRALRIADGAHVKAAEPLTAGAEDPNDVLRILGARSVLDRLVTELRPLLDLDDGDLVHLVEPMLSHVAVEQALLRVSAAQWQRWAEEGRFQHQPLVASWRVSSYAALAAHRAPSWDEVLAEAARRRALQDALLTSGYRESEA